VFVPEEGKALALDLEEPDGDFPNIFVSDFFDATFFGTDMSPGLATGGATVVFFFGKSPVFVAVEAARGIRVDGVVLLGFGDARSLAVELLGVDNLTRSPAVTEFLGLEDELDLDALWAVLELGFSLADDFVGVDKVTR